MVATVVAEVVEQLRCTGQQSSSVEIVIQIQQGAGRTAMTGAAAWDPPEPAPAADALNPVVADPLAIQPVVAPAAVRARQPFRRHIEGSRPYLVLGEGVRMINAHPVAHMVFWGGVTNWVLGAILAGHHVAGAVRAVVLLTILAGWLASCLHRTGRLGLARDSMQAIRTLLAEPATWVQIEQAHWAWLMAGLARCTAMLLRTGLPDRVVLGAARSPGDAAPADYRIAGKLAECVDEASLAVPRAACSGEQERSGIHAGEGD
jgi:hypothetical protein